MVLYAWVPCFSLRDVSTLRLASTVCRGHHGWAGTNSTETEVVLRWSGPGLTPSVVPVVQPERSCSNSRIHLSNRDTLSATAEQSAHNTLALLTVVKGKNQKAMLGRAVLKDCYCYYRNNDMVDIMVNILLVWTRARYCNQSKMLRAYHQEWP